MKQRQSSVPVLLILYNRPTMVAKSLAALRLAPPAELWVAADGPRENDPDDASACRAARNALRAIDWPCTVHRRFSSQHLGCRDGVIAAIDWFFEHVEGGIILEDDCVPEPTFFAFCGELLDRYAEVDEVAMIAGTNFDPGPAPPESYTFSRYGHMWGWATWRRAWRLLDRDLEDWPQRRSSGWLRTVSDHSRFLKHWTGYLDMVSEGRLDTWDVQWVYTVFKNEKLVAVPSRNLVSNLGFDDQATHTVGRDSPYFAMPTRPLDFPLRHPKRLEMKDRRRLLPSRWEVYMHPFQPGSRNLATDGGTAK